MNIIWTAAALAFAGLAARYLPHQSTALPVFAAAALLLLALSIRSRRRARVREAQDAPGGMGVPAHRRVPAWVWVCAGACVGLGVLVWALGAWVLWVSGAGALLAIFVRFRPGRSSTPSMPIVNPVSSPVDSGSWLDELPGRVADAVDAAKLIRGHADVAGVQPPDTGEEA